MARVTEEQEAGALRRLGSIASIAGRAVHAAQLLRALEAIAEKMSAGFDPVHDLSVR